MRLPLSLTLYLSLRRLNVILSDVLSLLEVTPHVCSQNKNGEGCKFNFFKDWINIWTKSWNVLTQHDGLSKELFCMKCIISPQNIDAYIVVQQCYRSRRYPLAKYLIKSRSSNGKRLPIICTYIIAIFVNFKSLQ